ncbi:MULTISPECIES: adenylate/guanylate cyclase domain-containing protein [unclassified Methylophilus]|uniref:adenylate/guanylate cyclase domain-containing protein n=1 Tax=unclassified Methylophilus TaxID=2630143 RepID=UPI0006FA1D2D|nr:MULTISPECIES: adenylate/guanylate cyclase domain-containing protein [unclassified Methylophilus]KQT43816.1 adenylate/guanylate cyclase [Methylophilus sp. Leaf416]KQT59300.1 adenylate/guanylate cyclase [Methylophilus sp. Leaf459]
MSLQDDLKALVSATFSDLWEVQQTTSIPEPADLKLGANHAKDLETATVLYADLDGSTSMVDSMPWYFSAEVYKNYLRCAALIIRSETGIITAYDGDRIMAVFTGNGKNTHAVRAAFKISYAVECIINPALTKQYSTSDFIVKHVIGIDTSQLHAARTGVRGDSDIVWIGRAANYAAKLTSMPAQKIWITEDVYNRLNDFEKFTTTGELAWQASIWFAMNNQRIYSSDCAWTEV